MNKRALIYNHLETFLIALVIGLLTILAAQAENKIDASVLNGLFTPTQAERFFQTGRENLEQEIEIFTHPAKYWRDDLLQIDPELIEPTDRDQFDSDYGGEDSPSKLHRDISE